MMVPTKIIEEMILIGGLICLQFVYAGNSIFMSYLTSIGIQPLTFVIFSSFVIFIVLSPISFYFERTKWPTKFTMKLAIQLVLISLAGVTLFQSFFIKGIELTSPAMAMAMPNLAPGFIFVIAWTFRLEQVNFNCIYSKIKIVGTMLCVMGALTMSILQSTTAQEGKLTSKIDFLSKEKIIGCLYLLAAVIVLSSNIVLQAKTLGDFPAPMSISAITSLIGVFITMFVQLFQQRKQKTGSPIIITADLLGYSLLGGMVSGASLSFHGWAIKKRGPVLVSMFSPIATVLSVAMSVVTLGESMSFGSLAGMCLVFTGLYFVLWAKRKEDLLSGPLRREFDPEEPLLS